MTDSSTSQWKMLSILLLGILIPLLAAAVPWLLDRVSKAHDLEYTYSGPVVTKGGFAYSLFVRNNGQQPEQDVQLWLPVPATPSRDYDVQKNGILKTTETPPIVNIDVSVPSTQKPSSKDPGVRVVSIPSLRPGETTSVQVLAAGGDIGYLSEFQLKQIRIVSNDTVGTLDEPSDEFAFLYKMGTWLFLIFFAFMGCYSIYFEYFMPHARKEKYLLQQIDKLGSSKS